jgi:hypothetical protein
MIRPVQPSHLNTPLSKHVTFKYRIQSLKIATLFRLRAQCNSSTIIEVRYVCCSPIILRQKKLCPSRQQYSWRMSTRTQTGIRCYYLQVTKLVKHNFYIQKHGRLHTVCLINNIPISSNSSKRTYTVFHIQSNTRKPDGVKFSL